MFDYILSYFADLNLWSTIMKPEEWDPVNIHPDLQKYVDYLPEVILRSKAPGTITNYVSYLRHWIDFSNEYKLNTFPASPIDLSLFFMHLMDLNKSAGVIVNVYYALKWVHSFLDFPHQNPTDNCIVKGIIESAKRLLAKPVTHRVPVQAESLVKLCSKYESSSDVLVRRDVSMCLLLFSGFLRFDELSSLCCNDIVISESHLLLKIRGSKTDQYRQGNEVVISRTGTISCPVINFEKYVSVSGIKLTESNDFLFKPVFRSHGVAQLIYDNKPISYTRGNEIIRTRLAEFVDNVSKLTVHSFRSGGATAAAAAGVSDRCFKKHGRWRSESAKDRYVEDKIEDRLNVTKSIGL